MHKTLSLALAAISLMLFSCSEKDEDKDVNSPVTVTLDCSGLTPAPAFSSVSRLAVYQVSGEEVSPAAVMVKAPSGEAPMLSSSFTRSKGGTYKYIVVSPSPSSFSSSYVNVSPSTNASREVPSFSNDVLWGVSEEMTFEQMKEGAVSVPLHRYGAIVKMKVNTPNPSKVSSVTVTFPSMVFGRVGVDPLSEGVFTPNPSSRSITLTNIDAVNVFRTMPLSLKKGDKISARFLLSDQNVTAEYEVKDDVDVADGGVFEFELSPELRLTFSNPVKRDAAWADPTIWKDGKTFYSTSTNGLTVWKSTDLVTWTKLNSGILTSSAKTEAKTWGNDLWAPDMIKIGSNWVLTVSARNSCPDSGICVFKSSSPSSGFTFVGRLTDGNKTGIKDSIDPEIVVDPATGKTWLFFGSVGRMHRVELASDGLSLKDPANPVYTVVAGLDINNNSSRSKVYEGCYLHYHDGYWYLFGSAGNYANYTYKIVVGRSATLEGTFVDKQGRAMKDGNAEVLMSSTNGDAFYGPGHNGEIFTDSTGQDYILYHCHYDALSPENPGRRYLMLQRIFWGADGWPYVENGKPAATDIAPVF